MLMGSKAATVPLYYGQVSHDHDFEGALSGGFIFGPCLDFFSCSRASKVSMESVCNARNRFSGFDDAVAPFCS